MVKKTLILACMGSKNWMFYTAYAVLVIGAGMAILLSERPLSATVVTWALFSFNVAAIVFVTPAFLDFIREVKRPADNTQVLQELKTIKEQLSELTELATNQEPTEQITMQDILHATARPQGASTQSAPLLGDKVPSNSAKTISAAKVPEQPIVSGTISALEALKAKYSTPEVQVATDIHHQSVRVDTIQTTQTAHKPEQISLFDQPAQTNSVQSTTPVHKENQVPESLPTTTPATPADAVITAIVHVEESDVVCIRGEGGGLNWQEGIPMTEEGADRWSYKANTLSTPATCRIYLNDEISAFGEDIVLQPGQYLEVSPSFPKVEA